MGWYTTCVCTTHHPINHCRLLWACMCPISTITHLPFDCHRLCTSPSYFGPLPTQFHPSQQLLSTFHTIVNFRTHTHLPFVDCHQLHICPMPMGHHHPPSTGFSTSSPSISCGPCYPCLTPAPLWPGVSSAYAWLGRSFGGVG